MTVINLLLALSDFFCFRLESWGNEMKVREPHKTTNYLFQLEMNAGLRLHWTRMSLEKLISLVPKLDYSPCIWIDLTRFVRVKVLECSAKDDINVKEVFRSFLALSKILPKNEVIDSNGGLKRRSSAYVSATSKGKRRAESPLPEKEKPSGSGTY